MSTLQQSKFCRAKKSITEESGRPGTRRSRVGCPAVVEPCTKRTVPAVFAGSPAHFSNRNSFTLPSLFVQWSWPLIAAVAVLVVSFMCCLLHLLQRMASSEWSKDRIGYTHHSPCAAR